MKFFKLLLTTLLIVPALCRAQQEEFPDSAATYQLEEVSVQAARVIRKADMDVYHPSQESVNLSSNGLQLLTKVMIPSVFVDEVMGTVKAQGQNVQLRINGRIATVEQVRNLQPESVKRIEWMDNPGLRYNDANFVLNFIVSNPNTGGSLMLNAMQMVDVLFGNYYGDLKLNHGKSQWNISLYYKPMVSSKVHRDYKETFTFPSGNVLTRNETPLGGKIKNYQASANISYSYIKPDTTIFYAGISGWSDLDNLGRFVGHLSLSDPELGDIYPDGINLINETGSKGVTPTLSLYLEQHFKRQQTLVVDFSASWYRGHSFTNYLETQPKTGDYITDIHTYISDCNQVYSLETDYIKQWDKSKLTAGVSYNAYRNRSKYRNLDNEIFHQWQDKVYLFGEYFHNLGKVTLSGGLGAQYTSFIFKETDQGSESWNFRPQATVTYSPGGANQLRLNFTTWQTTPSLSETNIAPQQTDGFQWNIGNPNLKTYNSYKLDLRYGFSFWRVAGNFNISASTSPKAIAPFLFWENNKLITTYENSIGKQSISFSLAPQIQLIPNWLIVSGRVEYLAERTRGTGYKLYNHNWNGSVEGALTHWNFTLLVQYEKARRSLWGQQLSWGEDVSAIALFYKWKDLQFGALVFMPFSKYDQGSKMLSKWNSNEYHLRLDYRMVGLWINYNIQWGKQKQQVNKLIENDSSVEKSSAKSR
ncbi:MAG: hypothetical protein J1F16_09885 [Muribaculaceae bacterium]|nr:hypothetical protein [Muribaculaceae bacterium]